MWTYLHKHHVFGGANRKHSEKHRLWIRICPSCHEKMHNDPSYSLPYKQMAQRKFEKVYGHDEFMRVFGRNYI